MEAPVGKIERFSLRHVWRHEASDFTRWLAENLDVLSERIGPDLTLVEREASAGDFSVDLVAEDEQGRTVIIENQLEKSDHKHLGQLLTYLAAYEAHAAIWVVGEPCSEHTKAVAWLNDSTANDFYLLRAEAIRIGQSEPALLLTPIVGPSEEAKAVAKEKQEKSERHEICRQFWAQLLESAASRTQLHAAISPIDRNWIQASAGRSGLAYAYLCRQRDWRVELYIDVGDSEKNKAILERLKSERADIESNFGGELEWQSLEGKQACRIATPLNAGGGYKSDPSVWPELQGEMIDAMIRLERALRPHIEKLPDAAQLVAADGRGVPA